RYCPRGSGVQGGDVVLGEIMAVRKRDAVGSIAGRCWLVFAFLLLTTAAEADEKRVALIIGNSGYVHMSARSNSTHDATHMARALEKFGFQVIAGYDLDKAGFEARIRDFGEALSGADVGVFFYVGRGAQVAGRNFLIPVDAQPLTPQTLDAQTVLMDIVYGSLEPRAKTKILLIDADRDNPLGSADSKRKTEGVFASPQIGVRTLIGFSTQPGNVVLDGVGDNSPYVAALLRRIEIVGQDLATILDGVRNDVRTVTNNKQIPWYHSS